MSWLGPALVFVTVLLSLRSCSGLLGEADALGRVIDRRRLLDLPSGERLLCYNEWVGDTAQLRARARMLPAALGRVCSMLGTALGVFQAAWGLGHAAQEMMLPAATCAVLGLLGWGLCFRCGARVRGRIEPSAAELIRLRRLFDGPSEGSW